jgi:enoyl-CoA hydratase
MNFTDIIYEKSDRVATVTLNRPDARNALSSAVRRALPEAIRRADDDADVDVVILTGADPAFCAGLDLKELGSGEHDVSAAAGGDRAQPGPIPKIAKPVIGAVNGVAITGGFELALNCDFLIASERARFADTHARVGIMPGWGLTVLLAEAVGVRRARQLSSTGNFLDAPTALTWGLVNQVVPHDDLLPTCRALAADIVSNDQAGVRRILQTYDEGWQMTGADAWDNETRVSAAWLRDGGAMSAEIEARRKAVMERGRAQTS